MTIVANTFTTTLEHYRKYIFMYGIMTVLYVLEYYESIEEFEECQKIIDAIKKQEERLGIKLYTRNNDECLKEVLSMYKDYNVTGEQVINISKYYATLVIEEIQSMSV